MTEMTPAEAEMSTAEAEEIHNLRRLYYGLLTRLLMQEPEPAWVSSLGEGLSERAEAARLLEPMLGEGWRTIADFLDEHAPEVVVEEYTRIFLGPHQPEVAPYESHYLTGMLFKEPLIAVRGFMNSIGLEKNDETFPEPEDILSFELEIMNWMLGREAESSEADEAEEWRERQAVFFKEHIQVWGPTCAKDLQEASGYFYRGVGELLEGFLKLEIQTNRERGPEKVETLEEARLRSRNRRPWKGKTYDPESMGTEKHDG